MKKITKLLLTTLLALSTTSCALVNRAISEHSHHDESETHSEEESQTSETTESEEFSESSESAIDYGNVVSVDCFDNGEYFVGDVYKTANNLRALVRYDSGAEVEYGFDTLTFLVSLDTQGENFSVKTPFNRAGNYTIKYRYRIKLSNGSYYTDNNAIHSTIINVKTLLGERQATNLELNSVKPLNIGDIIGQKLDMEVTYFYDEIEEIVNLDRNDDERYEFRLYKSGMLLDIDINTYMIEGSSEYRLEVEDKEYSLAIFTEFATASSYYKILGEDLTILNRDLDDKYAPATGDVSMLVIPITLDGDWTDDWTEQRLDQLNDYYFGSDPLSLKSYYEEASFGQMEVTGMISEVYVETDYSLTTNTIIDDTSYNKLFKLISNAVEAIENNHPEINFSDYDLNDDGCLDNVHLVTNFNTRTYETQTGNNPWGVTLWPHKFSTGQHGTVNKPKANVYSISANDHVNDAITAIHEQGHIFGLADYYDYGYTGADYVGAADMQSNNVFDWNSYSKLTVGWISPYVVRDECDITIGAASKTGDCLIIPADESTFNGSAFDEYFLIELFSPYGNNAKFVEYWNNATHVNFADYAGVRLYHVDSRVYKNQGGLVESTDKSSNLYVPCDNNCYEYDGRAGFFDAWKDYKLLALIQAGGVDTFGLHEEDYRNPQYRHYLNKADLFGAGSTFTFDDYAHFLSKSGAPVATMDNGETFPYRITFSNLSLDSVTIHIERI